MQATDQHYRSSETDITMAANQPMTRDQCKQSFLDNELERNGGDEIPLSGVPRLRERYWRFSLQNSRNIVAQFGMDNIANGSNPDHQFARQQVAYQDYFLSDPGLEDEIYGHVDARQQMNLLYQFCFAGAAGGPALDDEHNDAMAVIVAAIQNDEGDWAGSIELLEFVEWFSRTCYGGNVPAYRTIEHETRHGFVRLSRPFIDLIAQEVFARQILGLLSTNIWVHSDTDNSEEEELEDSLEEDAEDSLGDSDSEEDEPMVDEPVGTI